MSVNEVIIEVDVAGMSKGLVIVENSRVIFYNVKYVFIIWFGDFIFRDLFKDIICLY